jgi:hypothetical protein
MLFALPLTALAQEAPLPDPTPPPPPPPVAPLPDVPPPPAPPAQPGVAPLQEDEQPHVAEWRTQRKGFHWSIGGGGMVDPSGSGSSPTVVGYVALEPAASWSFGWVDAHVGAQVLGYFSPSTDACFVALDPQLRVNFTRWYSLGAGPYLGISMSPGVDFAFGATFSPAVFKIGDRGQHEISVWGAIPFMFTKNKSGITLLLVSYAYVF